MTAQQLAALPPSAALRLPLDAIAAATRELPDEAAAGCPTALLHHARVLEVHSRLTERAELLGRLVALRESDSAGAPPADLDAEIDAEVALDHARWARLDEAEFLADAVLRRPAESGHVAVARATECHGRVLAWRGDHASARAARDVLHAAADRYAALGCDEWQAYAIFWLGNAACLEHADLTAALEHMTAGLALLPADSPRRANVLTFLADVRITLGEWDQADADIEQALSLAIRTGDTMSASYAMWSGARLSSVRGSASETLRQLVETERYAEQWLDTPTGTTFLADAAELLERVGLSEDADRYFDRAEAMDGNDENVIAARGTLLARRGDPKQAIAVLNSLTRAPWLERRQTWRRTLLVAYAMLRQGDPAAGHLAARAFQEAAAMGSPNIAVWNERDVATTLLPPAAAAGSSIAAAMLAPGDMLLVRLLGEFSVTRSGAAVELPAGMPGQLFRLLAMHPSGIDAEQVIDALWPDDDESTGSRRLRDVLSRLRSKAGEVATRRGSTLALTAAWVDAIEFRAAADRALSGGQLAVPIAVGALAMYAGDLLPTDPYAGWVAAPREQLRRRRTDLLDLLARDAVERGEFDRARHAFEQAIESDPYDEARYFQLARVMEASGDSGGARRMLEREADRLDGLGLPPGSEFRAEHRRLVQLGDG